MRRYLAALVETLIAEQRNRRRLGHRVTLYTTSGATLRGVLTMQDAAGYELRQVEIARSGAETFRPVLRPMVIPAAKVEYYTVDD